MRYQVTEVKPDPTGTVPRKLLAVEWMTFTYTAVAAPSRHQTMLRSSGDPYPTWAVRASLSL